MTVPPKAFRYLFGPVLSRRMGRSLGVDLVPFKTCSFNCIFCQLGRTTACTSRRAEYVRTADVIGELSAWLDSGEEADFITLAGSGEPTLHTGFGRVLDAVRGASSIRCALLTNSSLLYLPEVRADAAKAHVVKVALSAWDQTSFEKVNRPHPDLTFEMVTRGIAAFRGEYHGELWLEVFLLRGINDRREDVERIADLASTVRADRIHLNTAVRPPSEPEAVALSYDRLRDLARCFRPEAEVVAGRPPPNSRPSTDRRPSQPAQPRDVTEVIFGIVSRHPCTAADVAETVGLELDDAMARLDGLVSRGAVRRQEVRGRIHYLAGTGQIGGGAPTSSQGAG